MDGAIILDGVSVHLARDWPEELQRYQRRERLEPAPDPEQLSLAV